MKTVAARCWIVAFGLTVVCVSGPVQGTSHAASEPPRVEKKAESKVGGKDSSAAVERALTKARRDAAGPEASAVWSPGGIGDVYVRQVIKAVRSHWGYVWQKGEAFSCSVRVRLNASGVVESVNIERSSGNAKFDASTLNAVRRTSDAGKWPPPPLPECYNLVLSFQPLS